jgi:hypothetical protein
MRMLKMAVQNLDDEKFTYLLNSEIFDSDEVLMLLYSSVVCFNSEKAFDILLKRNNYFKFKGDWHTLFSSIRIFQTLQVQLTSSDRRKFDLIALRAAFEKELQFMVDLILERSRITKELMWILLQEDQNNLLVSLIAKQPRPLYLDDSSSTDNKYGE